MSTLKAVQTTIHVSPDGRATLQLPKGIAPGAHDAVLVIGPRSSILDALPIHDVKPGPNAPKHWNREELYEDDMRGA